MQAILPPFLSAFLVAMETIPAVSRQMAVSSPALPLTSPLSDRALLNPAAQDWKATNTNKIIDRIPVTSFSIFIMFPFLKVVIGQFFTTDYEIFIFIIAYCLSDVVCWQHTFPYRKENRRTGKYLSHTAVRSCRKITDISRCSSFDRQLFPEIHLPHTMQGFT